MTPSEAQARIKSRIWKEIAQSDVDFSGVGREQMDALVEVASIAALQEVDAEIDEVLVARKSEGGAQEAAILDDGETVLWEGRPFLSLSLHYTITDERIRITEGMFGKARENVELIRIQDMDYHQSLSERMINRGDIEIRSHDPSHPRVTLENVKDPEAVYETLRRAVLDARKRHNLSYREEM